MEVLVSIIVPIYNASKTIEKTIDLGWNGAGIFLGTKDKEVIYFEAERHWEGEVELNVYPEAEVISGMLGSKVMINELADAGAIDKNQVMIEKEKIDEKNRLKYEAANEKREKELYEKLKQKFENQ